MSHLHKLRSKAVALHQGEKPKGRAHAKGMLEILDYEFKVELALEILEKQGYYVENLWQLADVQGNYQCSDMIAKEVLKDAIDNEYAVSQTFEAIDEIAKDKGLKQIHDV